MIGGFQVGPFQQAYQQQAPISPTLPGGSGGLDDDYIANQRKTRRILEIKRQWAEKEASKKAAEAVLEAEIQAAETERVQAEVQASALLRSITDLGRKIETVREAKKPRIEAKRVALQQERAKAVEKARLAAERAVIIAAHREEIRKRRLDDEAGEALMVLMMLDYKGSA